MKIATNAGYDIHYEGGRLADVMLNGHAIECVQVRDYDLTTGDFGPLPTRAAIKRKVAEAIDEAGGFALYLENC